MSSAESGAESGAEPGAGRHAPAAARNRDPILGVLRELLPARGTVLEIASGTGEHVAYFAPHFSDLVFQPSEPDQAMHASIVAWARSCGADNIRAPLAIDTHAADWGIARADAMININMIHISPWSVCQAMLAGAGRILAADGPLYIYGPFMLGGRHTAPSNAAFDRGLRAQDERWGVRDLDAVIECARASGLEFERIVEMPANNLSVIFRRQAGNDP